MSSRNWSNIVLAASLLPNSLFLAFVVWYIFGFRPSGEEQWGDAVVIFYLGAITFPFSVSLLVVGSVLAVRWRRINPAEPTAGPFLFVASVSLLASPWLLLVALARGAG